jgi:hypothetical protein
MRGAARLVAVLALVLLGALAGAGASGAATPGVPYTDPNASGYIGLCNQAGQQITSGSVTTTPFVWRAVSSQAAPSKYSGTSRTATLTAYLPIQVLPPGDWSGEELTSASRYSNPDNPMAAATDKDVPLETFLQDFPPEWDGFIQLRMYLGAADQETYEVHYPTLDIQVTGDTWQAFGGGPVNCNSGSAESIETALLPSSSTTPGNGTGGSSTSSSTAIPAGTGGSETSKGSGSSGSKGSGSGSGAHSSPGVSDPVTATTATTSHVPLIAALVIAALAVLATLLFFFIRRRRPSEPAPPEPTTPS